LNACDLAANSRFWASVVLTAPAVILSCELGQHSSTHSSLSMKLSRPVRIVATDLGVSCSSHGVQEQTHQAAFHLHESVSISLSQRRRHVRAGVTAVNSCSESDQRTQ
jgi:hypothetical protein